MFKKFMYMVVTLVVMVFVYFISSHLISSHLISSHLISSHLSSLDKHNEKYEPNLFKVTDEINKYTKGANDNKDTYILFDCIYNTGAESIDAYSLFLYMQKEKIKAYYVVVKDTHLYNKLKKDNALKDVIVIDEFDEKQPYNLVEAIWDILPRTKAIVTSFGTSSWLDFMFARLEEIQYVFIQHGQIFFKENCFNGYLIPIKYNKVLVSSDIEVDLFKKYGWEEDKLIKAGLPRYDLLNEVKSNDEKSIFIMFTWRYFKPEVFRQSMYYKNLISLLKNKDLQNFLLENNVKIYFAPHHAWKNVAGLDIHFDIPNVEFVDTTQISHYIKKSSLLVSDYSSVVFDFIFQNKPVVLYGLDVGDKLLSSGEYMDLEALKKKQSVFPNIYFDEKSTVEKIEFYVKNDFLLEKDVIDAYSKFFYVRKNIRQFLTNELERITSSSVKKTSL